ncbi:phosphopantetheine-binding protein, partial [Pseudomonas sp. KCJK9044]
QLGEQLKARLRSLLPDYMVPTYLVLLTSLPLSPNGKLDRKALPEVDAAPTCARFRAPQTELERQLALIWQEVLGLERVGLDDDFFALGGHSLQAVMLLSRIRGAFGVELPVKEFYELRQLGQLATHLQGDAGQAADELDLIFGALDELEESNA